MKPYALLQELGFGEYEAKAYVALLGVGQSTGYEVAKAAAIPRPNVYAVLDRLVARGAAQRFDTAGGVRYAATPASRMLRRLEQKHQRTLAAAREGLATLVQPDEAAPAFTLRSEAELLERARAGIDAAREALLLSIRPSQAAPLADALQRASDRDVRITTLCLSGCEQECGACRGDIYRLAPPTDDQASWLLLVVDRSEALVGHVEPSMVQGVATAQRPMIELTGAYIRQSLTLALLADELEARIEKLLSPRTRRALDRLYPGGDFLAHIRSLGKLASSQMRQVSGSRSKE